jgi:two-component system chemotaxis response regulator CheY
MTSGSASIVPVGTVLIVDDSAYARSRLKRFLLERGFRHVVEASDGDQALRSFAQHRPRLVLMDQVMRGRAGIETARVMMARDPTAHVIMLTVVTDRGVHEEALHAGIERVLQKADYDALAIALREIQS